MGEINPQLTAADRDVIRKVFSDPFSIPVAWKQWLVAYLEGSTLSLPISQQFGRSGVVELIDVNNDLVTITNSTAYATIFEFDIPAETLQTKAGVVVEIGGKWTNTSGSASNFTLKITYGTTVLYECASFNAGSDSDPRAIEIRLEISNEGATNVQRLTGHAMASDVTATPTTGYGALQGSPGSFPFGGTSAEDSKVKKAFKVEVKLGVASANNTFEKFLAHATRISH